MNISDLIATKSEPGKKYAEMMKICGEQKRVHILDQAPRENEILVKAQQAEDLLVSGKCEEALPICRELSGEFPKWSRGWILLGNALWQKSQKEKNRGILKEAKNAYTCASKICSRDPTVNKGLGKVAFSEGDFELALDLFKLASKSILADESGYYHENPTLLNWIKKCEMAIASAKRLNLTLMKV